MSRLSRRRWRNVSFALIVAALIVSADSIYRLSLQSSSFWSGWILIGAVLFLAAYNVRKKLPMLPLGSSAGWLQCHIYAGLLSGVLFAVHIGYRVPNGGLETGLAALYLIVFLSGVGGLVLSRVLATRLTTRGDEVLFERIPVIVRRIREEVQGMVLNCISETETSMVPEFYRVRLQPFFARPRYQVHHLVHSNRPYQSLLLEMRSQHRYLNDRERDVMREIEDCVQIKNTLDYQYTLQSTLKHWLFLHVPLTYALLIFAAAHIVLVYSYFGGL